MSKPQEFPDGIKIGGISIVPTQGTKGKDKRLRFQADEGNGCELELVPGENWKGPGIVGQVQLFGPELSNGRQRLAFSVNQDPTGECAAFIDSTVTGGSTCNPMPMLMAMGEAMIYVGLYPNRDVYLSDRTTGKEWKGQMSTLIAKLLK